MSNGLIKLTPAELRTSAVKYQNGSEEINSILQSLTQEQEVIRSNWSGNSFDSFDNQFNELSPKIQQFSQLLQDINAQLIKVADIIEETDNSIASQINA